MADVPVDLSGAAEAVPDEPMTRRSSVRRNLLAYAARRVLMLAVTVATAVYLTILIANYGGYLDTIVGARIQESVGFMLMGGWLRELPSEERLAAADELVASMRDAAGLNEPFLLRTFRWLGDGLTLNWGKPDNWRPYGLLSSGITVGEAILGHLSRTLLLFGLANLLLFGVSVLLGLFLSRRRGGLLDRLFVIFSPLSSAPAWVYGVLLGVFFLRVFGFSPGGTLDTWSGGLRLNQILVILRHLFLPFLAIFLAGLFQTVYVWRSFFQVYSHEEYVEMAYAKGLPNPRIDRNYILRPALPALLTRFGLLLAVLWQEVIALEYFFNVRGVGRMFVDALTISDTPMIVAIVTVFAYLVAITVFLLDIAYMLVDPRVRLGGRERHANARSPARLRRAKRRGSTTVPGTPRRPRSPTVRFTLSLPRPSLRGSAEVLRSTAGRVGSTIRALRRYPSAIFGLAVIALLLGVSAYTVVAIPYDEAVALWRGDGRVWERNPRQALPAWVNLLRREKLPPTVSFDSAQLSHVTEVVYLDSGSRSVTIPFTLDYPYGGFPQDIVVDITASYEARGPHVTFTWVWPDGRERELTSFKPKVTDTYFVSRDDRLKRRLRSELPHEALFLDPDGSSDKPMKGTYTLRLDALLFEPDTQIDARVTVIGQVFGPAGTDAQRRDLMIALLWGTPVALAFGLIAAFATSVGGMLMAALGAWYGGGVDRVVQFLTEVNLILPFFPVSLMVFVLYSKSIITILAVVVALTIFGSALKSYRAVFLQLRTAPYIEAARAYGASDLRIVLRYMVPRIITLLIPRVIILVPGYVFLEATLAFLGVTDPHLPTWGKLVVAALSYGVHSGAAHLVLAPLGVLFLTGFAFAMVGLALERVFEPKLRDA
jgi:peptide/nickel transport system permease protein